MLPTQWQSSLYQRGRLFKRHRLVEVRTDRATSAAELSEIKAQVAEALLAADRYYKSSNNDGPEKRQE